MPTLSLYSFAQPQLEQGGAFAERHVDLARDSFATDPIEMASRGAALAIVRPDDEDVIDLNVMYNSFAVSLPQGTMTLYQLAAQLVAHSPTGGSLRGPLRSAPLNRAAVPSFLVLPPEAPNQVLTELHIDFHLNTPAGCYAHEGTITFYVQFLLGSAGQVSAAALAEWFTPDTNPDFCKDTVNNTLNSVLFNKDNSGNPLPGPFSPYDVRSLLNAFYFAHFNAFVDQVVGRRPPLAGPNPPLHRRIYALPGDGRRIGVASEDASTKYSLGLERTPAPLPQPQRLPFTPDPRLLSTAP